MLQMKRVVCCTLLVLVQFASWAHGQDLIIDQVRKTVVYLQGEFPCHEPHMVNGAQAVAPDGTPVSDTTCPQAGTGFLIEMLTPDLGPGVGVPLLVTSKHLIRHQSLGARKGRWSISTT